MKDEELINLYENHILPDIKRAKGLLQKLNPFTFNAFKQLFYAEENITGDSNDVIAALLAKEESMRKDGRVGNAMPYRLTANTLKRFVDSLTDSERTEHGLPAQGRKKVSVSITLEAVLK